MSETRRVEGRTICPICDTDKSWTFSTEAMGERVIAEAIRRMNQDMVEGDHEGHVDKLQRAWHYDGNDEWHKYE